MSFVAQLRAAVKSVFSAIGDLKTICTYYHAGDPAYSPATGQVSTAVSFDVVEVVLTGTKSLDQDYKGERRITMAWINAGDLSPDPRSGDWLVTADGKRWWVLEVTANNGVAWGLKVEERV